MVEYKSKPALSAGIIGVYKKNGEINILLLRAYKNWDFPKGEVGPNENPFDAALRELKEETLISNILFPWGSIYRETVPYSGGKVARYYLAECTDQNVMLPVSPELGGPEHHEYRWVSFEQARKLVNARLLPILAWAEKIIE